MANESAPLLRATKEKKERLNYTVYNATFSKKIWLDTENFTNFLALTHNYKVTYVFVDSPKSIGFLGLGQYEGYIWFNSQLSTGETVTVYYKLKYDS